MLIRHVTRLLSRYDIGIIREAFEAAYEEELLRPSAGLNDSDDVCNKIYESKRSPGLSYGFLDTQLIDGVNFRVAHTLAKITGMLWAARSPLPVFCYRAGGRIVEHRDRDVGLGNPEYVAVCMLTEAGKNFAGGRFFVNVGVETSEDGKTVHDEDVSRRISIRLGLGDALVFHNPSVIHGCTEVEECGTQACRMIASWRSAGKEIV